MEIRNLVVARFLDGRVIKGITRDFSANRPSVHIDVDGTHEMVEVRLRQLKALFFVKAFEGFPGREDVRGFIDGPAEQAQGRKIAVRFRDGEFMCGYTMSWSPDRDGFFMFPADPGTNNDRLFVIASSAAEIKAGPQAEVLAQRTLAAAAARGASPGVAATGVQARVADPPVNQPNTTIGPRPSSASMKRPESDAA